MSSRIAWGIVLEQGRLQNVFTASGAVGYVDFKHSQLQIYLPRYLGFTESTNDITLHQRARPPSVWCSVADMITRSGGREGELLTPSSSRLEINVSIISTQDLPLKNVYISTKVMEGIWSLPNEVILPSLFRVTNVTD